MNRRSAQPTIDCYCAKTKPCRSPYRRVLSALCGIFMLGFRVWRNQFIVALTGAVETYFVHPGLALRPRTAT